MPPEEPVPETRKPNYWNAAIGSGLLAIGCLSAFQFAETQQLRTEMASSQAEIQALQKSLAGRDTVVERKLSDIRRSVEVAKEEVSTSALSQAQAVANRQTKALAAQFERQQRQHRATSAALDTELKRLQEESERSFSGVKGAVEGVRTEMADVRSGLATTQTGLQRSDLDLNRVRGDLGVMSGLIATNSKEIAALRELGDRAIYEFALPKNGQMQRVGDIRVKLKKTDARRNRYTMEILAEDKLVEKKDRTTNEPDRGQ
jgi:hypothetical protein